METAKIPLKEFTYALTATVVVEFCINQLQPFNFSMEVKLALLGVARLVQTFSFLIIFLRRATGLNALGLGSKQLIPGLRNGLMWSAAFGLLVCLCATVIYLKGNNPLHLIRMRLPEGHTSLALFLLIGGVVGPVAEEILFRGILYEFLRYNAVHLFKRWHMPGAHPLGLMTALSVSTLAFVFLHSTASPIQAIGGVLFTLAYEKEKKLMVPIVIHILGNLALYAVALMNIYCTSLP